MTLRSARGRRIALAVAVLVLVSAVLAGCSETAKNNRQNSLEPKGPAAQTIDNLFKPVAVIAIVVGIFIVVATVYVAHQFRRRPGNENPKQVHGNTPARDRLDDRPRADPRHHRGAERRHHLQARRRPRAEGAPGHRGREAVVVGVPVSRRQGRHRRRADHPRGPRGEPEAHRVRRDDPVDCNVIHSFWVPELAGKKDVVPGHDNHLTIEADKPGTFLGQCAEYCGLSHANMRFRVIAKTADDFDQWLSEQQQGPAEPLTVEVAAPDGTTKQEPAGEVQDLIINTFACAGCHTLDDSSKPSYGPNLTHLASPHHVRERRVQAEPQEPRRLVAQRAGA